MSLPGERVACLGRYKCLEKFCDKSQNVGFGIVGRKSPETSYNWQISSAHCSGQAQNGVIVKSKSIQYQHGISTVAIEMWFRLQNH